MSPADPPREGADDYPRLLSLAAHELRTPVSVIAGYVRMLQRDPGALSDQQRRIIDETARSCERLAALVNELSDVGKIDAGLNRFARNTLDLFPLVAEAVGDAVALLPEGPAVSLSGDDGGAEIEGDRTRLKAAFGTIVRAVAREQTVPVVVNRRLSVEGGHPAAIVIAGPVEASDADLLPRARLDEQRGGLGLALPIARRILVHHGGEVWSPAGDGGQAVRGTIVVRLPCVRAASDTPAGSGT